jgi:hypothetical protein
MNGPISNCPNRHKETINVYSIVYDFSSDGEIKVVIVEWHCPLRLTYQEVIAQFEVTQLVTVDEWECFVLKEHTTGDRYIRKIRRVNGFS